MDEKSLSNAELVNFYPTPEQILELQDKVLTLPQIEPVTDHFFVDGMYCRKVWRPAGTLIIGKIHKKDHIFVCVSGEIMVWSQYGFRLLKPGDVIQSVRGTKRVTFALKESIAMTVHRTNKLDIELVEKELVEDEPCSPYVAGNKLRELQ